MIDDCGELKEGEDDGISCPDGDTFEDYPRLFSSLNNDDDHNDDYNDEDYLSDK